MRLQWTRIQNPDTLAESSLAYEIVVKRDNLFSDIRYKLGARQSEPSEPHASCVPSNQSSPDLADYPGADSPDPLEGLEEDEEGLLRWTASLDYEEYWLDWKRLATTACSEAATG